jgi:peptide/nickel transport system ATP-binding protein
MIAKATGSPSGAPVLSIEKLVVDYRGRHHRKHRALDGVSFSVGAGEIVGIVGESGSGKSTLGRVIAGLIAPTSGSIQLPSHRTAVAGSTAGRPVQIVLQESANALDPRLRVDKAIAEAIAGSGRITRTHLEKARSHLPRVGLRADYAKRRPMELSGGEKQRVAIARALAARPRLLVCDEVTSALDVSIQATIVNVLLDLHESEEMEMIFITHDIALVGFVADRVVVLKDGKIVEEGPTLQILADPKEPYTRELIGSVTARTSKEPPPTKRALLEQ